ncbi:MAG TPA: cellulase family glycosylhydrolase [Acidimicrobiales bacterium]|nr:cellulase family glycosylhydrolase [Acidimicrobiales bacterium]
MAGATLLAACGGPAPPAPAEQSVRQFSPPPGRHHAAPTEPSTLLVSGPIGAPGGPYLRDRYGRVVLFHGVNAVYKYAPFIATPAPGRPWNFGAADAARIAGLGFNVVRLGLTWQGIEPGVGGPNNPAVCTRGTPRTAVTLNASVARAYLTKVARTVDLLGRDHVYTILDMHQDVWNQAFRGEGAPGWAVCTDGLPLVPLPGRWSANYRNGALNRAMDHFWANDVVGNLQGHYDAAWGAVARVFGSNPWILGYDPFNEPFTSEVTISDTQAFAGELECFYTGTAHPGYLNDRGDPLRCPATVPATGVVPTIEAADPHHLVFVEPDIFSIGHQPNLLGPMDFSNLVFNFHSYCGYRSPLTGDPTNVDACAQQQLTTLLRRGRERPFLSSPRQPGGPPWFMSEFGATHDNDLLDRVTGYADLLGLGWTYWSWKYYDDPTGSTDEELVSATGHLESTVNVLSRTYAQAVAGTPVSVLFDPGSGSFKLAYVPSERVEAPTVVFVAARHYPEGYCTVVSGGHIVSPPGATHLLIDNNPGASDVDVTVDPGRCPPAPTPASSTTSTTS